MTQRSAHEVRDLIIDRISGGQYALGSKLPPARQFADETGAHRNTVVKAYHALADLGLVTMKQGRGTFVAALTGPETRPALLQQLEGQLATIAHKARHLGVLEDELRAMIDQQIAAAYVAARRLAAFVECNQEDLRADVAEIEVMTGYRLTPLLLDDLRARAPEAINGHVAVFTSPFHVKEVSDILEVACPDLEVVAVYTQPDEQALSAIATIPAGSRVGIVCSAADGARRFANEIANFSTSEITARILPTDDEICRLAAEVDVIVGSRSRAAQIASLALPIPTITLPFHVSPQSVGRISDVLAGSGKRESVRSVS